MKTNKKCYLLITLQALSLILAGCSPSTQNTIRVVEFLGDDDHYAVLENTRKILSTGSVISPSTKVLEDRWVVYIRNIKENTIRVVYSAEVEPFRVLTNLADTSLTIHTANGLDIYKYNGKKIKHIPPLKYGIGGWIEPYTVYATLAENGNVALFNLEDESITDLGFKVDTWFSAQPYGIVSWNKKAGKTFYWHNDTFVTLSFRMANPDWINGDEIVGLSREDTLGSNNDSLYDIVFNVSEGSIDTLRDKELNNVSGWVNRSKTILIDYAVDHINRTSSIFEVPLNDFSNQISPVYKTCVRNQITIFVLYVK